MGAPSRTKKGGALTAWQNRRGTRGLFIYSFLLSGLAFHSGHSTHYLASFQRCLTPLADEAVLPLPSHPDPPPHQASSVGGRSPAALGEPHFRLRGADGADCCPAPCQPNNQGHVSSRGPVTPPTSTVAEPSLSQASRAPSPSCTSPLSLNVLFLDGLPSGTVNYRSSLNTEAAFP